MRVLSRREEEVSSSDKVLQTCSQQRGTQKKHSGYIVGVSTNGALIKLDNWINLNRDETANLQLDANDIVIDEEKTNEINVCGRIKRITKVSNRVFNRRKCEKLCQYLVLIYICPSLFIKL